MFDLIKEALSYTFMQRALLVGIFIALSSSMLGLFLVLRKYSMIGDGLAHVSFATVAIALFLNASPILISIPIVTVASIFIMQLNDKAGIHGDAAIGLVSSFAVAFGVLISSVSSGFNVDLYSYLFGSILAIQALDFWLSMVLAIGVVATVIIFYNDLFAITYDESFASVTGIHTKAMGYLISILTSITIVIGIRVVGTLLISSLIVFPTVSALQVAKSFKWTLFVSVVIAIASVVIGVIGSYVYNLPSGASIVVVNGLMFVLFFSLKMARKFKLR